MKIRADLKYFVCDCSFRIKPFSEVNEVNETNFFETTESDFKLI